jgi:glucoamylase
MPLVWAHAEHLKLLRSLRDGAVFDMPPQTVNRYIKNTPPPAPVVWQLAARVDRIAPGRTLRLEFLEEALVHWTVDNWTTSADSRTVANGLGMHFCDLPTIYPTHDGVISFTVFWTKQNRWEGTDFQVAITDAT